MKQLLPLDILVLGLNLRGIWIRRHEWHCTQWDGMAELQGPWPWLPWEKTQWHWWAYHEGGSSCCLADMSLLCYQASLGSCLYSKPDSSGSLSLVYEMIPYHYEISLFISWTVLCSEYDFVFYWGSHSRFFWGNMIEILVFIVMMGRCICWKFPCLKICTTQFTSTMLQ